jgi:hypothetical protein
MPESPAMPPSSPMGSAAKAPMPAKKSHTMMIVVVVVVVVIALIAYLLSQK